MVDMKADQDGGAVSKLVTKPAAGSSKSTHWGGDRSAGASGGRQRCQVWELAPWENANSCQRHHPRNREVKERPWFLPVVWLPCKRVPLAHAAACEGCPSGDWVMNEQEIYPSGRKPVKQTRKKLEASRMVERKKKLKPTYEFCKGGNFFCIE